MNVTTALYVQTCCRCGVMFGMPGGLDDQRRRDHKTFYCPNGHGQSYTGQTDAERLRAALDQLAWERAEHEQTRASLRTTKGVVTKQRKRLERVVAGVCPVDGCKRHFNDLAAHMATKHPDYSGGSQ